MEKRYLSKNQYSILLAYSIMAIFTSDSLKVALMASCVTAVFLLLWIPLASLLRANGGTWIIYGLTVAAFSFVLYYLQDIMPFAIPEMHSFLLPGISFLFLLAPLINEVTGAEKNRENRGYALLAFGYYSSMVIVISFIRELFGYHKMFGETISFIPESMYVSVFAHTSGSAILVILMMLIYRFICSKARKEHLILAVEQNADSKIVHLQREEDLALFRALVIRFFAHLLAAAAVMVCVHFFSGLFDSIYLLTITCVGVAVIFHLIFFSIEALRPILYRPYPFVSFVLILLLPFNYMAQTIDTSGRSAWITMIICYGLVALLSLGTSVGMLYERSISRRLIFGETPDCLKGIPFQVIQVLLLLVIFFPLLASLSL